MTYRCLRDNLAAAMAVVLLTAVVSPAPAITVSVKDYGAKGDGTTDDAEAVRKAVQAVAKTGEGTLTFPKGTYLLKGPMADGQLIDLPANVNLVSEEFAQLVDPGHPSVDEAAWQTGGIWKPRGAEWSKGPMVTLTKASGCEIRGIQFHGTGPGIYMTDSENCVIKDCRFVDHSPMGIYGERCSKIEVSNCDFGPIAYGLYLRGCIEWLIENNRVEKFSGRGIESQGMVRSRIVGNKFDGAGKGIVGILMFPNSNPKFGGACTVGNLIENNEVCNVVEEGISLDCRGNAPEWYYGLVGKVARADKTSFTDATNGQEESWNSLRFAPTCCVVIVDGRGEGQYRVVESVEGQRLTVSPEWDVIPSKDSTYCLLRAAVNNRIVNNKVDNVHLASIMLWGACLNNEVRGNTVTRAHTRGVAVCSLRPNVHQGMSRQLVCWDNRIVENKLQGTGKETGIDLVNRYGDDATMRNYRNTVIDNEIDGFSVGVNVQVQRGAVVRGNKIKNCPTPITRGDHLADCTIE